ncbi:UDP-N-acetylmuramoyl-tripeptide--D-alanyl-D-alanine ligase [Oceanomicrobium pacificus]|uniref:UDP-N-acetylmuramoyl-tripeptide--D-alanyl-D-alanine ligase n=1 Tax=Oceanomicrobium pacificus TaxID=2692916 RepID=A0A6B0U378_9RHOB|nr:UDP-N-acetylmuramoyl-tripeptide--D-alanyl-D-alanine ligase [Oceanomicrobium pacificus]MXU65421.1 UDP-N-acetylmuramoyl-tripeptide--D-alanyl-D-alanine ligase [Oceanomicrobium pacificus]
MSALWTAETAARATGGQAHGDWAATGVSIDSRSLAPGDLFVALADQRDGHDFVAAALAKGAAAALVTHRPDDVPDDAPLLVVPDVLKALEGLAVAARARSRARVIAVTGSVGKTTTKNMLAAMLGAQGHVHAAEKSFNNHWGVPLTLARLPQEADFAVIEIGMNAPGEIAPLSQLARPHVAIITTVAPVHLAAFQDVRGIAEEKASIFTGLEPGGTAIICAESAAPDLQAEAAARASAVLRRFGEAADADMRLDSCRPAAGGSTVEAHWQGEPFLFNLRSPGRHLAMNALAALTALLAVDGDLARALIALGAWRATDGRGAQWSVALGPDGMDGQFTLIDESYNANPLSMAAALDVLAAAPVEDGVGRVGRGRRIAILGDMLELGDTEEALHAGLADLPVMGQVDLVHTAGPLMAALHAALDDDRQGRHADSAAALVAVAARLVDAGDTVMVKGSKGSRVADVAAALLKLGRATRHGTG